MKMNKRIFSLAMTAALLGTVTACGSNATEETASDNGTTAIEVAEDVSADASTESTTEEAATEDYTIPEGMYLSELTGEPISEDIKDQRRALPCLYP